MYYDSDATSHYLYNAYYISLAMWYGILLVLVNSTFPAVFTLHSHGLVIYLPYNQGRLGKVSFVYNINYGPYTP